MARRIPWVLWLGALTGFLFLRHAMRRPRRPRGGPPGGHGPHPDRNRVPREPEVTRGPTPVELGLEEPVATGVPAKIPERSERPVPLRPPEAAPDPTRFEPVVPDAPEEWDPRADPVPVKLPHAPVPPTVRKRR
jgi:hypothetical protein